MWKAWLIYVAIYAEMTDINRQPITTTYSASSVHTVKKLSFGLLIVCLIACSWVGSSQTTKSAFTGDFSAPFFSTWFGTTWMIVLFPLSAPLYFLTHEVSVKDLWK